MPSALEQSTIPPSNFFTHRESLAWVRNGYRPRHAQVGNDDHVLQASRKIGRSRYIRIDPVSVTPAGLLLQGTNCCLAHKEVAPCITDDIK